MNTKHLRHWVDAMEKALDATLVALGEAQSVALDNEDLTDALADIESDLSDLCDKVKDLDIGE